MKNDIIDKVYNTLTSKERFSLAIKALAANDNETHNKLIKSCPKKTYSENISEFTDLAEYSDKIAMIYGLTVGPKIEKLRALRLLSFYADPADPEVKEIMENRQLIRVSIKNWYEGYQSFSKEYLETDVETLIAAWLDPLIDWKEEMLLEIKTVEADPEEVEAIEAILIKGIEDIQ